MDVKWPFRRHEIRAKTWRPNHLRPLWKRGNSFRDPRGSVNKETIASPHGPARGVRGHRLDRTRFARLNGGNAAHAGCATLVGNSGVVFHDADYATRIGWGRSGSGLRGRADPADDRPRGGQPGPAQRRADQPLPSEDPGGRRPGRVDDLESTNGTKVNGENVQLWILRPGDVVSVGRTVLLFGSRGEIARRLAALRGVDLAGGDAGLRTTRTRSRVEPIPLDFELNFGDDPDAQATLHTAAASRVARAAQPGPGRPAGRACCSTSTCAFAG